ncbi:hypothetical protein [Streptosporangium saharense]|uniref:Uncharacterized protein n=1 Tax=Streptosporangium saharense TaxID=1706840 RepID=A0A7W7QWF2_9ACTN|nr:hypothetical protein [Streptosporangium saharense]MBB4920987.1 hypothetical protein [Streptosporangium saharense]
MTDQQPRDGGRPPLRLGTDEHGNPTVTLSLKGLNAGATRLVDQLDTILGAVAALRAGDLGQPDSLPSIDRAVRDLDRLDKVLGGLTAALIRQHYIAGGSHGQLAAAMEVQRSTAQMRAERLPAEPTYWENWVRGTLPT